jgi:hypothetical protein
MKRLLALSGFLIACAGASARPQADSNIGIASLEISAPAGRPAGTFRVTFDRPVRVFTSPDGDLSSVVGWWLVIEFRSDDGHVFRLHHDTVEKWPHADGVRAIAAGDPIATRFSIDSTNYFFLETASKERIPALPPGHYDASATFKVPIESNTKRLKLTPLSVAAPSARFEVASP